MGNTYAEERTVRRSVATVGGEKILVDFTKDTVTLVSTQAGRGPDVFDIETLRALMKAHNTEYPMIGIRREP